ncbi:hypothetical protein [Hyphomicrobium sp. NDB2Meth4]|uniref:hypothetical protein n=1 Tax=Hyphomicrobium sp. NDB2Meth4 TaxID=1892846 RepID=UPI000930F48E|nr:hypothetical protein [Hyphomicrobium sp. NDB2Meth4]
MTNDDKQPPRKPDLEVSYMRGAAWDNRASGGGINVNLRFTLKDVAERIQEAKDNARDGDRKDDRREPSRESSREDKRSSGREDRQSRDNGPRYER